MRREKTMTMRNIVARENYELKLVALQSGKRKAEKLVPKLEFSIVVVRFVWNSRFFLYIYKRKTCVEAIWKENKSERLHCD